MDGRHGAVFGPPALDQLGEHEARDEVDVVLAEVDEHESIDRGQRPAERAGGLVYLPKVLAVMATAGRASEGIDPMGCPLSCPRCGVRRLKAVARRRAVAFTAIGTSRGDVLQLALHPSFLL